MATVTVKSILKEINCESLQLVKMTGHAYWFFTYFDGSRYETHSVYTPRLNDMPKSEWVAEGRALVEQMEGEF